MITCEYKGQTIEFNEYGETWQWQSYSDKSLAKVKEYMDRNLPKKWKPTPAYYQDYGGELKEVKVRSAQADGSLWIQSDRRTRGDKAHRALFTITPKNRELVERITALTAERSALNNQIDSLWDQMERFTAAHIEVEV